MRPILIIIQLNEHHVASVVYRKYDGSILVLGPQIQRAELGQFLLLVFRRTGFKMGVERMIFD